MSQAKATAYLELNIKGFQEAIQGAKRALMTLVGAFAAFKVADLFKDGVKGAIEFGDEMFIAARKAGGFDPGKMLLMQKAIEETGRSTSEARNQLDLLVESGRPMATLFATQDEYAKAMKQASANYGSQAAILSRSAERMSVITETLSSIGEKIKTFFLAAAEQFLKPLQVALDALNAIDLAGMGEAFGKYIADAINFLYGAIKNGTLWEIMRLGIQYAFESSVNWLNSALQWAAAESGKWLGEAWEASISFLQKAFTAVFSTDTWNVLKDGFLYVASVFGEALMAATEKPVSDLMTLWDFAKSGFNVDKMKVGTESTEAQSGWSGTRRGMADATKTAEDRFTDSLSKLADSFNFGANAGEGGNIFDSEGTKQRFDSLIAEAFKTGAEALSMGGEGTKIKTRETAFGQIEPFKVLADSLQSVGGGGGYAVQGMSIEAQEMRKQTRINEMQLKAQEATNQILTKGGGAMLMR